MNPYFLMLYCLTAIYRWLDISNLIHFGLMVLKNVKLAGSLLLPDPKGTVDHLRGGILKISYVDPQRLTTAGPKGEQPYVLLPYSIPALPWTKVYAITNEQYERGSIPTQKQLTKSTQSPDLEDAKPIDADLLSDIADASETPVTKPVKVSLKAFEKTDVTDFIEMVAGPGKDFFGCNITPAKLNSEYRYLIFHYHRKTQTFAAHDSLSSLRSQ